ncbi:hypothetical protein B0H67DRAFT_649257 [Lasiosphaeris hirsuta]|uniref:Uncharacterized protein n=1 Tax=Lasiosphaeris hirsuta TaxID=260670 RepID=A0AA40DKR1_9PEZI|nr:hypothetical protein B0H67DRAFT_649257 [Lasiosphaeris hirsuta]
MANSTFNHRLRTGTPAQVLQTLREAIENTSTAELTSQLLSAVETDSIPPTVLHIYIPLSRDPKAILAALEQTHSTSILGYAIKYLAKVLRSESGFASTWTALGGAPGIARLMRELSVANVDRLCRALGSTGSALAARDTREQSMSELLDLLCRHDPAEAVSNRDPRPLRSSYKHLAGACTAEVSMQWETESWSERGLENLYRAHLDAYGQQALRVCLSPGIKKLNLRSLAKPLMLNPAFLVAILTRITLRDAKDLHINPSDFFNLLALPLAKRAEQRKPLAVVGLRGQVWSREIWELIALCLKKHPDLAEELNFKRGGLLWLAINRWDRAATEEFNLMFGMDLLQSLMRLVPASQIPNLCDLPKVLGAVSRRHRYDLLVQTLCLPGKYGINIASPEISDKAKLSNLLHHSKDIFTFELFESLPVDQSLSLLDLLSELSPDNAFLRQSDQGSRPITNRADHETRLVYEDFTIIRCFLLGFLAPTDPRRRDSKLWNSIEDIVEARKAHAAQCHDWARRYLGAQSALILCIVSGFSQLYSKTLLWARRFDKDVHVVGQLYGDGIRTEEGLDLLCGIPSKLRLSTRAVTMVEEDIRNGNRIILQLLDAAAGGLQEPFFAAHMWYDVKKLASNVVARRFRFINAFQSENGLSDEEVYDLVWQSTLDMLVKAEKFALQEEHERLCFAQLQGPLSCSIPENSQAHVWKFLDNLARARDELWQQERIRRRPSVSTLGFPWPKGLPAHFLCNLRFRDTSPSLPYVLARAEAVVFGNPKVLLSPPPEDEESQDAIEGFVDDYDACLQIFVDYQNSQITDRHARLVRAWNYANTHLTGDRMTAEEARIFWYRLASFRPQAHKSIAPEPPQPKPPGPVFPAADHAADPTEWHPNPTKKSTKTIVRELDFTCLDSMLIKAYSAELSWPFRRQASRQKTTATIPARPSLWDLYQYEKPLSGETADAFVAAGILSLNSKAGSDTSLLMRPYPTAEDPRFPALYLADEFLKRAETSDILHDNPHLSSLGRFRQRAPVELIYQLTASVISRLRMEKRPNFSDRQLAINLLRLLITSERPVLAWDLIRDMVINRPGESSWHRHVFTIKFFSSLSAKDARFCLEDISKAMVERLKSQAQNKEPTTPDEEASGGENAGEATTKPAIKVTTVKLLAEVLRGSKFTDELTICRILGDILESARHIDIRVAATQSLIEVFNTADNGEVKSAVLEYLRLHVVPAAASLDESRVMTNEDWGKAEMDSTVPDVNDIYNRPLLGLLLYPGIMTPEWKEIWTTALLGEVLELSVENSRRWVQLFLKANRFGFLEEEDLPALPIERSLLGTLLRDRSECITAEVFDLLQKLVMTNLSPPPNIAAITKAIKRDPVVFGSNGGKHWLWLFSNKSSALGLGAEVAATMLNKPALFWTFHRHPNGVTVDSVQMFIFSLAEILIFSSDGDKFNRLLRALTDYSEPFDLAAYRTNTRPVITGIVALIDKLRTPAWQADPRRRPRTLPDTFPLSLQLMRYPSSSTEIVVFAEDIVARVDALEQRIGPLGTPYHENWEKLRRTVLENTAVVAQEDFLRIAAALVERIEVRDTARGLQHPGLAEHLVVELAAQLIQEGGDPGDEWIVRWARVFFDERLASSKVEVFRELSAATFRIIWAGVQAGKPRYRFWSKYEWAWVARLKDKAEKVESGEASELDE